MARLLNKEEFKKNLIATIEEGKRLLRREISDSRHVETYEQELWKWHEFNVELVKHAFTPSQSEYLDSISNPTPSYKTMMHAAKTKSNSASKILSTQHEIEDRLNILERLLHKMDLIPEKMNEKKTFELEIFISHSSKDINLASSIVELLKTAFSLSSTKIRCTSVPGYMLSGGISTDKQLNQEIHESKLLIALITENSISSHYVMFELGARWGVNLPLIPIVCRNDDYTLMKRPLNVLHAINIGQDEQIYQLVRDVGNYLDLKEEKVEIYSKYVQNLSEEVDKFKLINLDDATKVLNLATGKTFFEYPKNGDKIENSVIRLHGSTKGIDVNDKYWIILETEEGLYYHTDRPVEVDELRGSWKQSNINLGLKGNWGIHFCKVTERLHDVILQKLSDKDFSFKIFPEGAFRINSIEVTKI